MTIETTPIGLCMTAALPKHLTHPHLDTPRLLIVDDDFPTRELFQRVFGMDYHIQLATNGLEALDYIEMLPFDAVLLDLMMPQMDGFQVLQAIRAQKSPSELPVILISGKSGEKDIVQGLQLGANDFLPKPFNIEIAAARIRTQIELKLSNDLQRRVIQDLQATRRVQETFYRIVSHDLKGPLTNLHIAQSILRDMVLNDPTADVVLDNMEMTIEDMLEMIRLFLDVSALQEGALAIQIDCVSLRDVILGAVNRLSLQAKKKNVHISLDNVDGLILADSRLLNQILGNLISNALKYSPAGSTVSVWVENDNDDVLICIADQGPGIPADERDSLFEMFRTLSPRPTDGESSHGLGLWIVRQLVEQQGGEVAYAAPPDGGSIFMVKFSKCPPGYKFSPHK